MASIDTLIQNQVIRTNSYASAVDNVASDLKKSIYKKITDESPIKIPVPGIDEVPGVLLPENWIINTPGIDNTSLNEGDIRPELPAQAPGKFIFSQTESTFKELSDQAIAKPDLIDSTVVDAVAARAAPTIDMSSFFNFSAPESITTTQYTDQAPNTIIADLITEINDIESPVLDTTIVPPVLSLFNAGEAPNLIPTGGLYISPETISRPEDYAWQLHYKDESLPASQLFIDEQVEAWLTKYAPEYGDLVINLKTKINATLTNGEVLSADFESALMNRARGRSEQEFSRAQAGLLDMFESSGFIDPPGTTLAGIYLGRLKSAGELSAQSTEAYLERRRSEIQHLQFVMSLASTQIQGLRSMAQSYASTALAIMQHSVSFSTSVSDYIIKGYDHLLAYSSANITILGELRAQYELDLKTALGHLEVYRAELESESIKSSVELGQVKLFESRLQQQQLEVERYKTLIDSVTKKAELDEKRMAFYELKSRIVKENNNAIMVGAEAYKAVLTGDSIKADGMIAKIDAHEKLIAADQKSLDLQVSAIKADELYNDQLIKKFDFEYNAFIRDLGFEERRYDLQSKVNDTINKDYEQQFKHHLDRYALAMDQPKVAVEAAMKNFEVKSNADVENARLILSKLQLYERAGEVLVEAFRDIASNSVASLNTMVSSAIQAAA